MSRTSITLFGSDLNMGISSGRKYGRVQKVPKNMDFLIGIGSHPVLVLII